MKEQLENLNIGNVYADVDVKNYTTFKVSALASFLVIPDSLEHLILLLRFLKENHRKYKVIGRGSNLIFVHDYDGVLIRLDCFSDLKFNDNHVIVGAGYSLMKLALNLSSASYTGLEFATGIPASVGGALVNNAGAYGSDMASIVQSVKVLTPDFKVETLTKEDLHFSYRSSFLQYKNDYICLEVELVLEKGEKKEIEKVIQERREKRFLSQPLDFPSAGSVFRNPEGNFAGKIIEELGFKGKKVGGALVSCKHANFIVNTGNATGKDIQELIFMIKEKARNTYHIDLICEQEFVE